MHFSRMRDALRSTLLRRFYIGDLQEEEVCSTIKRIADEALTELVRPIATAPRELNPEGEPIPILVYDPSEGGWQAGVWVCAGQRGSTWFRQGWCAASDWDLELRPTHWMPVPPHPHELFAVNDVEAGNSPSTRSQPAALVSSDA